MMLEKKGAKNELFWFAQPAYWRNGRCVRQLDSSDKFELQPFRYALQLSECGKWAMHAKTDLRWMVSTEINGVQHLANKKHSAFYINEGALWDISGEMKEESRWKRPLFRAVLNLFIVVYSSNFHSATFNIFYVADDHWADKTAFGD